MWTMQDTSSLKSTVKHINNCVQPMGLMALAEVDAALLRGFAKQRKSILTAPLWLICCEIISFSSMLILMYSLEIVIFLLDLCVL